MQRAVVLLLTLATRLASAGTAGEPDPVAPEPDPVAPEAVSGVAVADEPSDDPAITRVLLFPVRIGTEAIAAPFRGAAYLLERYQLRARLEHLLFSDDGTLGVYPTALVETHLGWNAGAHVVDSDLFGRGEKLAAGAGYGGALEQYYDVSLATGARIPHVRLAVRGSYQAWDRSPFFGIGNARVMAPPAAPIDALADGAAVATRFGQDVSHAELAATAGVAGPFSLGASTGYTHRTFDPRADLDEFAPTVAVYMPSSLVGFATGTNNVYGELDATLDTRTAATRYISRATPSTGWWLNAFGGVTRGFDRDPSRYVRYGADLRRYVDLYHGDRVLVVRGYFEGVTAPLDQIPFTDLPRLGGNELLRGFEIDRFRDRIAALASVEYEFPVHYGVDGYVFVDTGRVADGLGALAPNALHTGYGAGLQLQTLNAFLLRAQLAHSTEGTFLRLALDPMTDLRAHKRRL